VEKLSKHNTKTYFQFTREEIIKAKSDKIRGLQEKEDGDGTIGRQIQNGRRTRNTLTPTTT
jgi:hypothetical protein